MSDYSLHRRMDGLSQTHHATANTAHAIQPGHTVVMQGGLDKLAGAAATVDALSQDAHQQRIQLRASQVCAMWYIWGIEQYMLYAHFRSSD